MSVPSVWRALLAVCAVFACVLTAFATSAAAQTVYGLPSAVDASLSNGTLAGHLDGVGASQEVIDHVCNVACQRLSQDFRATMPSEFGGAAVRREGVSLLSRVGALPSMRALGTIGLGISAFDLGWKIGTGIRASFVSVHLPKVDPVSGVYQHYEKFRLEPCDYIVEPWSYHGRTGDGYSRCNATPYPIYHQEGDGVPTFALRTDVYRLETFQLADSAFCPDNPDYWPDFPLVGAPGGSGYYDATGGPGGSSCGSGRPDGPGWTMSLTYALDVGYVEPFTDQPFDRETPSWPGEPTSIQEIAARARTELQAYAPFYKHLIAWYDSKLGGPSEDPTGQPILATVPSCIGITGAACEARLREAGFTNVTASLLSTDDAVMDRGPGEVVRVIPSAGESVDPSTEVQMLVNPPASLYPHAVPSCRAAPYDECVGRLEDAGLHVHHRATLSFDDAVPYPEGKADEVIRTDPAANTRAIGSTDVEVVANPGEADMPRLVPAIRPDEPYTDYAPRLEPLALVPNRVTLPETDYDFAAGAAISSTPGAGTRVRRDVQVDITANPDVDVRTDYDPRCEPSAPLGRDPGPDPTAPPGLSELERRYRFYYGTTFLRNTVVGGKAKGPKSIFASTALRWGHAPPSPSKPSRADGWGYRHIAWNHGWAQRDADDTRDALTRPAVKVEGTSYIYVGPPYKLNKLKCMRVVIVAPIGKSGEPNPKDIISSYGATQAYAEGKYGV